MKSILFTVLFLVAYVVGDAQGVISGKVITESGELPLAGASVYINGSLIGTTTNDKGEFAFRPIKNGFYDIIVSFVGYELIAYRATVSSKDIQLVFKLTRKPTELRNVVVLSKDTRAKWLKIFRENFLGNTFAATKCKILNEDEILFEDGNSNDSIKAFSVAPLELVNKELGYKIYFELAGFYFSPSQGRTYFYGYSRFEELSRKRPVPARYTRKRELYYLGSTLHFFHSLISETSIEQGYATLNIRTMESKDTSATTNQPSFRIEGPGNVNGNENGRNRKMRAAFAINPSDFFSKDTVQGTAVYKFDWKEQIRVTYSKNPYTKALILDKFSLEGLLPLGVYTDIDMLESPVYMDGNGSLYDPLAIQMRGFWSFEKMANMLPIDYRPGKSN